MPNIKNHNKLIELFLTIRASIDSARPGTPLMDADPVTLLATERVVSSMATLLEEFGDEMVAAVKLAAVGEGTLNEERNRNISSYHQARVSHLTEQIASIDGRIEACARASESGSMMEELNKDRQDKLLVLNDHQSKLSNRNHGVRMTSMRSRR